METCRTDSQDTELTKSQERTRNPENPNKMEIVCKSCRKNFESTFSVDEFSLITESQDDSGTLHLCPHCGNLSIYSLVDYHQPS